MRGGVSTHAKLIGVGINVERCAFRASLEVHQCINKTFLHQPREQPVIQEATAQQDRFPMCFTSPWNYSRHSRGF